MKLQDTLPEMTVRDEKGETYRLLQRLPAWSGVDLVSISTGLLRTLHPGRVEPAPDETLRSLFPCDLALLASFGTGVPPEQDGESGEWGRQTNTCLLRLARAGLMDLNPQDTLGRMEDWSLEKILEYGDCEPLPTAAGRDFVRWFVDKTSDQIADFELQKKENAK